MQQFIPPRGFTILLDRYVFEEDEGKDSLKEIYESLSIF